MTENGRQMTEDGTQKTAGLFSVLCLLLSVLCSLVLFGCEEPVAPTEGIKIGELASTKRRRGDLSIQFLRTTNIDIVTYELPVDKIADFNGAWQILSGTGLIYNDPNGFFANGLQAAAGKFGDKTKISSILKSIKAKQVSTTSLLIESGQISVLEMGKLPSKTAISYIGRDGTTETAEAGPAVLGLQVYARQLTEGTERPTSSRVQFTPAILSSTQGLPPELAAKIQESDIRIYSAGFGLNLRAGDIIVLAPNLEKLTDPAAAAGRFFTKTGTKPTVRILLFICTSIN